MKYFETDGIRGKSEIFTKEFLTKIVNSLVVNLKKSNNTSKILIGGDTRISTDEILTTLTVLLSERGIDVKNVGVMPTPAISFLTSKYGCDYSIVVTASHNPYTDNGIKILNANGEKLDKATESILEESMDRNVKAELKNQKGNIEDLNETAKWDYISHLTNSLADIFGKDDCKLDNLKIGIDCANGATSQIAETIFSLTGTFPIIINQNSNYGTEINNNCGSTHLESLKSLVTSQELDFGMAFDGDGDRCLMIDHEGNEIDGDHIIAIIANQLRKKKKLTNNKIATTVMANQGLIKWAEEEKIDNIITAVGDSNVYEAMCKEKIAIGGEQSGHIILPKQNTGDGILTALVVSKIVKNEQSTLKEVSSIINKYPQILVNIKASAEEKAEFATNQNIQSKIKEVQRELETEKGRLLVRPSGTEPIIRVSMWGLSQEFINQKASELAEFIEFELNMFGYRTNNLFDLNETIATELFNQYEYPWEILDHIEEFIKRVGPELDPEIYQKDTENHIYIAKTSEIEDSKIKGPVIICPNASVGPFAYVRPNVIIGEKSVVGHAAEVKNTIIFNGAHVAHRNYVGDSVVGYKVNMGNGSCTANLKLDSQDKASIKITKDQKLEVRRKFGAIIGDFASIGCIANLQPGVIIGKNASVYGSTFVRNNVPKDHILKNEPVQKLVLKNKKEI